jgi:hypothetical protein
LIIISANFHRIISCLLLFSEVWVRFSQLFSDGIKKKNYQMMKRLNIGRIWVKRPALTPMRIIRAF